MRQVALIAFFLAGCASVPPPATEARTIHLICDKTIPLDVSHDGQSAVVRNRDGEQVLLKRVPTAPGVRYEGAGISVMRTDGVYVFIARDGSTYGCDPLSR